MLSHYSAPRTSPPSLPVTLGFLLRDSELIRAPQATPASLIVQIQITTDPRTPATLTLPSGTLLSDHHQFHTDHGTLRDQRTLLLRLTQSGLQALQLTGQGAAQVHLQIAGDLNQDGQIDGTDRAQLEASLRAPAGTGDPQADLNGDGQANATDRQILLANQGFNANRAPQATAQANAPALTHTDLDLIQDLSNLATDPEGDRLFWGVIHSTHGHAQLEADGHTLRFTPDAGYSGPATVTLQADDGFARSAPIQLTLNVSDAPLTALRLTNRAQLQALQPGQSAIVQVEADFTDQTHVAIQDARYLTLSLQDLAPLGYQGPLSLQLDYTRDRLRAQASGAAWIQISRQQADHRIQTSLTLNVQPAAQPVDPSASDTRADEEGSDSSADPFIITPDVYPGTLTLVPGLTRQLKVHLTDPNTGEPTDIHTAQQTLFAGTAEQIDTYLDPATQTPLLDPLTGDPLLDPETGEVLLDPLSGTPVQIVTPAQPALYSGTRYCSSDDTIASVSADGLITAHQSGDVILSIIHLGSQWQDQLDADGKVIGQQLLQQAIGQTDLTLHVQAPQTSANQAVAVRPIPTPTPPPQRRLPSRPR